MQPLADTSESLSEDLRLPVSLEAAFRARSEETGATVHDDEHGDWLYGGSGRDWLFAELDRDLLVGRRSGERVGEQHRQ